VDLPGGCGHYVGDHKMKRAWKWLKARAATIVLVGSTAGVLGWTGEDITSEARDHFEAAANLKIVAADLYKGQIRELNHSIRSVEADLKLCQASRLDCTYILRVLEDLKEERSEKQDKQNRYGT